jgi:putative ABC transport system ATP-binding protein
MPDRLSAPPPVTAVPPAAVPRAAAAPPALTLRQVSRLYGGDGVRHWALRDVDLDVARGEMTAIMGPSGSGKTTLLHIAAGLDRPTRGTVHLGDIELTSLRERKLTELRRERLGFVFQAYNLVPSLTVAENLELPFRLAGRPADRAMIDELVSRVGLADRVRHLPYQLSGGEQQRAAIARAVVTRPDVVLADEPTGALDLAAGAGVLDLLREVADDGQTVVLVTHDPGVAAAAHRTVILGDGHVVADLRDPPLATLTAHVGRAPIATAGGSTPGGSA